MIFGERWVVYHMVSVLPFILMLLLVGNFCKKRYGYSAALLTVLILASAPQMLCFALEVRMYSWAQLFVVLSAVTALSVLDQESWKKMDDPVAIQRISGIFELFCGCCSHFDIAVSSALFDF